MKTDRKIRLNAKGAKEDRPMLRKMTLQIEVTVPESVGETEVETEINAALDDPPSNWQGWTVGGAVVIRTESAESPDGDDADAIV